MVLLKNQLMKCAPMRCRLTSGDDGSVGGCMLVLGIQCGNTVTEGLVGGG